MSQSSLEAKLAAFLNTLLSLRPDYPPSTFTSLANLFSPSCVTNPQSMREHNDTRYSPDDTIAAYKEDLALFHRLEIRITSQIVDEKQRMAAVEMKNRLMVNGYILDPFYETAVIRFDEEGLIVGLNMYSCRSPIVALVQKATGLGPYSDADHEIQVLKL